MSSMDGPDSSRPALDEIGLLRKSNVFCMAPWTHLHVLPTGEIFPCCMSAHESLNAVGNLRNGDSLLSAWNSSAMKNLRTRMLAGKGSELCERCYKAEDVGQETWRTAANKEWVHHFPIVRKTRPDGGLEELNLPYLDIRFSNICNLKCRICTPKLSSRWYNDARALRFVSPTDLAIITATEDPDELWNQIAPLLPFLERFHFAGGEPLVMEDHYRVLDRLRQHGKRDVKLSYNTNLSVLKYKHYDAVELWQTFRHIYMQASLDGMGARGDYMRKGQNWDLVVANRRRLIAECPHIEFCVLATVSIMNVLHMPEFYKTLVETGLIRPQEMQLNILFEPEYFNVRGLPPAIKRRVNQNYQSFMDEYLPQFGAEVEGVRGHFQAVLQYMWAEDWDLRETFIQRTAELDQLRKERFQDIFPELNEFVGSGG